MENIHTLIFNFLTAVAGILLTADALILFLRSRYNNARTVLAFSLLLWGLMYLFRSIGISTGFYEETYPIYSPYSLISGIFYISLMFLFPLEVVRPSAYTRWRALILLAPLALVSVIGFAIMHIMGEEIIEFYSYSDIFASIGMYNIWFRLVLLIINIIYSYLLLRFVCLHEKKYTKWKNDNFSDQEYVDISWMKFFLVMLVIQILLHMLIVVTGYKCFITLHTFFTIVFFSFIAYKALYYKNPYPDEYYAAMLQDSQSAADYVSETTDKAFQDNLDLYVDILKKWMDNEKPYLYSDFKLMDVGRALPLNRTYLSRVINAGFGMTFSELVGMYRVEYAKKILLLYPSLPLIKIAEKSGFSSGNTFTRTFRQITGVTPNYYRQSKGNLQHDI